MITNLIRLSRLVQPACPAYHQVPSPPPSALPSSHIEWNATTLATSRLAHSKAGDAGGGWPKDPRHAFEFLKSRILFTPDNKIEVLDRQNGFKLFGIEQRFKIDQKQLQREMRKLQNLLHPDRFVAEEDLESQERSNTLSAMVNDFYHILSHPYERAKHLLSLTTNKSPAKVEESLEHLEIEQAFLARMLEIRELIETPPGQDIKTLQKLDVELQSELDQLICELNEDFAAKNMESILKKLGKLKFVANCHRKVTSRLGTFSSF